jgi:hypothetical protein
MGPQWVAVKVATWEFGSAAR